MLCSACGWFFGSGCAHIGSILVVQALQTGGMSGAGGVRQYHSITQAAWEVLICGCMCDPGVTQHGTSTAVCGCGLAAGAVPTMGYGSRTFSSDALVMHITWGMCCRRCTAE
jgi:hypothetical protein